MTFNHTCHWCSVRLRDPADDPQRRSKHSATRDHVFPKSQGGQRTVWCCRHCNQIKGDLLPGQWKQIMRAFPDFRRRFKTNDDVKRAVIALRWSHRRPIRAVAQFPAGLVPMPPLCRGLPL